MISRQYWLVLLLVFIPAAVWSYSGGITGRTAQGVGCGRCHGITPGATQITAQSGSGSWTVQTGQTLQITIIVAHSSRPKAGVNIAVKTTQGGNQDAGNLQPASGSGLKKVNNELTQQAPKSLSGGQVSFQFSWQAPSTPGTYYLRVAANAVNNNGQADTLDEWKVMTPVAITVVAPQQSITVLEPNGGEQWCRGTQQLVRWEASNVDKVDILLSSDGGQHYNTVLAENLDASQGSWMWDIPSNFTQGTQYRVLVRKHQDATVADESDGDFAVYQEPGITAQSQSQQVCEGDTLILTVQAVGGQLEYQWRKDGQPIPGATEPQLRLLPVQLADSGTYDVMVSGLCGPPVTSEPIHLQVLAIPQIVQQPVSQTVCTGDTVLLAVVAEGDGLSYQWYKDGNLISGANSSTLQLFNVTEADAGSYQVIVSGSCSPAAVSDPAILTVLSPPVVVQHPKDTTVTEGATVILEVAAQGENIAYQWRKDEQPIPGATSPQLVLQAVQLADSGWYDCQISNLCGTVLSEAAHVVVQPAGPGPVISLSQTLLDFDTVVVGSSGERQLVVTNTGSEELDVTEVTITGTDAAFFTVSSPGSGFKLKPDESKTLTLRYEPQQRGSHQAELSFVSNAVNQPVVPLRGFAGVYLPQLNVQLVDFGTVPVQQPRDTTIVLANFGDLPVTVERLKIHDDPAGVFSVLSPAVPLNLAPGESVGIVVAFQPVAPQSYTGRLRIRFTESVDPIDVPLAGNAVATSVSEAPEAAITITPSGCVIRTAQLVQTIELWDILGRRVTRRVVQQAGTIQLPWSALLMPSLRGTWLLRVQFQNGRIVTRLIVQ